MNYQIIFRDDFNDKTCLNWESKSTVCENKEAKIQAGGQIVLSGFNLTKFRNYRVEFEVFSDQETGINIGYFGTSTYYLRQSNQCDLYSVEKLLETYSFNPYKNANTWHKGRFEPRSFKISEYTFEAPTGYDLMSFHFHKFGSGYLKVRNFRISIPLSISCKSHHRRQISIPI